MNVFPELGGWGESPCTEKDEGSGRISKAGESQVPGGGPSLKFETGHFGTSRKNYFTQTV